MNRLKDEPSPYLRLHAQNPIDWYPWGQEALQKAKRDNSPIFLSIGYSTCHWCHVMNRETFADQQVGKLLNDNFIAIKVDREQHPDVDEFYMDASVKITGSGGWPLNLFLAPDLKPFFAGSYFPKDDGLRNIGFISLLKRIKWLWENDRQSLVVGSEKLLKDLPDSYSQALFNRSLIENQLWDLKTRYDTKNSGFLPSPKFPQLHTLLFVLDQGYALEDKVAIEMANNTLKSLLAKGCYDQVGGGIFRYSTDSSYKIPHFEKMLYDNAFLIYTLAEFYRATKELYYKKKALEILTYLEDRLQDKSGGFYTAEDADTSEGEGGYYLFSEAEIKSILSESELDLLRQYYQLEGNFRGKIYLYPKDSESFELLVSNQKLNLQLKPILKKLKNWREAEKTKPFVDTKILVFANGLLLAALSKASLWKEAFADKATKLFNYLERYAQIKPLPGAIHGRVISQGHLDDYAFLAFGFLEYGLAFSNMKAIELAKDLTRLAEQIFYDPDRGGFFSVSKETILPKRAKNYFEGALPGGNSIMSFNLYRLMQLTGEEKYRLALEATLNGVAGVLSTYSTATPFLAMVGSWYLDSFYKMVLTCGCQSEEDSKEIELKLKQEYLRGNLFWVASENNNYLKLEPGKNSEGLNLYLCQGDRCESIITGKDKILAKIAAILS